MRKFSVVLAVLVGAFLLGCAALGPTVMGPEAFTGSLVGSYSGTYQAVPASSNPDYNGNVYFTIAADNKVTGYTRSNSGIEDGIVGILNGTEIQAKTVPKNAAFNISCTFTGTLTKVNVVGGQPVPVFTSSTTTCPGMTGVIWTWTASRIS